MIHFEDGLAREAGEVLTYLFDSVTNEYLGTEITYVHAGFSVPAGAVIDAPPDAPQGQVAAWQSDAWVLLADHRGLVYRTSDGQAIQYQELGELPSDLTTLPKPGPTYVWDESAWVVDDALDLAIRTKEELRWIQGELLLAGSEILKHEDQDPTAIATEEAWRRYRVALRAWPQEAAFPDSTQRPVTPVAP